MGAQVLSIRLPPERLRDGAWDLVLDAIGYAVTESATRLRTACVDLVRRRGRPGAPKERTGQIAAPWL